MVVDSNGRQPQWTADDIIRELGAIDESDCIFDGLS